MHWLAGYSTRHAASLSATGIVSFHAPDRQDPRIITESYLSTYAEVSKMTAKCLEYEENLEDTGYGQLWALMPLILRSLKSL